MAFPELRRPSSKKIIWCYCKELLRFHTQVAVTLQTKSVQLMYCLLFLALLAWHCACHLLFCSALLSIVRGELLKHISELLGCVCPGKSSCVGPPTHPPTWQTSFVISTPLKSQQKRSCLSLCKCIQHFSVNHPWNNGEQSNTGYSLYFPEENSGIPEE